MRHLLWLLAALAMLAGCAKKAYYEAPAESYAYDADYSGQSYGAAAPMAKEMARSEARYDMAEAVMDAPPPPPAPEASPWGGEPAEPAVPRPDRMVHYDGHAHLSVARPDETADAVVKLATDASGHLERMGAGYVTVRVPVASFDAVFEAVLDLGDVVSRSIYAEDVTEAFQATDLRLKTATAARDRLVALLAKAEEEEEKLRLVREIQRVSEEIDRLEAEVRTLRALAALSRITVELSARQALAWSDGAEETVEFAWIRQLSPFGHDRVREAKTLRLEVPQGMVALAPRGPFVAESADGSRIWSGRLLNSPRGDTAFWVDAVEQRLETEFASAEVVEVGSWRFLRLVDRSDEPYTWMIGLSAQDRWLRVVEIYFPNAEQEERYRAAVVAALTGGAT